jgi:glucosamine--fructose-6-phosphate aminotransferase (isomerizing)
MCGIVGYVGQQDAAQILLEGLRKLEYRGYDSAGIAIHTGESISVVKEAGRIAILAKEVDQIRPEGSVGIAHTRWATHGEPNRTNAHPHTDDQHTIAVVHNGIIENYLSLKQWLAEHGTHCSTDTDTEVVAHLASRLWDGDLASTMRKVVGRLRGSYALALVHSQVPEAIVVTRKDSPLVIGEGVGEMFVASDITALLSRTRDFKLLEDNQIAVVTKDRIEIIDREGHPVNLDSIHVDWDAEAAEKGGYEHFMLKEMMEQPKVVRDTIRPRINHRKDGITFDGIALDKRMFERMNKIFITACGTAYHAGMVAKYLFEHLANIPVEVEFASEFRYRNPLVDEKTLAIVISQSGETADTLAALREAKRLGAHVLAIVNTVGSSIAREADDVIYTWAGPEIAVASTKAYIAQLSVIHLLAVYMATLRHTMDKEAVGSYLAELEKIPEKIGMILEQRHVVRQLAARFARGSDIFFIGRGFDYNIAMEGSLKLKEISYIHSEAYAAGELKHGTIALIEKGTFIAALCTQSAMIEKMIANIKEVKARGAQVLGITCERFHEVSQVADMTLYLPDTPDVLVPILAVVPLQLFAYYCALERHCDVDKPRNLAKSVTVE